MPDSPTTKELLADSMKVLMKQKDFSKISVGEVCEYCGINRKSFYYHFRDKYDLVNWIYYVDFLEHIHITENDTSWTIFSSICHYFYTEADFYRNALNIRGQNSFCDYFYETLSSLFRTIFQDSHQDEEQQEFFITFYCDAFYFSITRWLTAKKITPVEVFLEQTYRVMEQSANLFINRKTPYSASSENTI